MEGETCEICTNPANNVDLETYKTYCGAVCHVCETGVVFDELQDKDIKLAVYEWGGRIKYGLNAFVVGVFNKKRQEHTILKIQKYKNNEFSGTIKYGIAKEIKIACKVSCVDEGFIRVYDYFMCQGYPSNVEFAKNLYLMFSFEQPPLSYIEMQRAEGSTEELLDNQAALTHVDKLYFFFEIVFSLNVALKKLRFEHNDIASRNILYVTKQPVRIYEVNGTRIVVNSYFRPLIADFGMSSISAISLPVRTSLSDLRGLRDIAKEWGFVLLDDRELKIVSEHENYDLFLALLYDRIIEAKNTRMIDDVLIDMEV